MNRLFLFLYLFTAFTLNSFSQSLYDLDREPSFKGITIGEPISKYNNFLKYQGYNKGTNAYTITDTNYLSIFNIKMDKGIVVEKNGRVEAIFLSKTYSPGIFYVKELEVLQSSLTDRYGQPNVNLTDFSDTPSVAGVRWQANSIVIDVAYLFYGTNQPGSGLRYILYKRNDDY